MIYCVQVGGSESRREGPWPACVTDHMTGADCVRYIETYADDVRGHVQVVEPGMMVTMDFRTDRVWVWVDEEGLVQAVPKRG